MRFYSEQQALDWLTKAKTNPYRINDRTIRLPKGETSDRYVTESEAAAISYLCQEHDYSSAI